MIIGNNNTNKQCLKAVCPPERRVRGDADLMDGRANEEAVLSKDTAGDATAAVPCPCILGSRSSHGGEEGGGAFFSFRWRSQRIPRTGAIANPDCSPGTS